MITVIGRNFGAGAAIVLVGPKFCLNIQHDPLMPHSLIRCVTPPGTGEELPVLVLQGM